MAWVHPPNPGFQSPPGCFFTFLVWNSCKTSQYLPRLHASCRSRGFYPRRMRCRIVSSRLYFRGASINGLNHGKECLFAKFTRFLQKGNFLPANRRNRLDRCLEHRLQATVPLRFVIPFRELTYPIKIHF